MNTNPILINRVVYEVQRIYAGNKPASELVRERLLEARSQIPPLTEQPNTMYNNIGTGMSKEKK